MKRRDLREGMLVMYKNGDQGIVTSWNETAVFVRYWLSESRRFNPTPAATPVEDLCPHTLTEVRISEV